VNAGSVVLLGSGKRSGGGGAVTPIVRPFPPPPAGSYDHVLPWTPPQTRDYLRGDFWAVECPGLPAVPGGPSGGSSEFPQRIITGLDYKYDRTWWPSMVDRHRERGYTHWLRWSSNALYDLPQFGGNPSINKFVDDCGLLKHLGMPYVIVSLTSKVFDPRDPTLQQYQDRVGPLLDALLSAKAVDELIPGFEFDAFNVPGKPTIDIFKWVGQQGHARGVSCWAHFYPEHTAWFADGDPRGRYGFWDDLGADVDGLDYQADAAWDVPELQARIVDTLSQFGAQARSLLRSRAMPFEHKMRLCEDQAIRQFSGYPVNNPHPNELDGAQRGFYACCTIDNVAHTDAKLWGYGNGGMNDDGTWL
jgi:hypothetical protein